MQREALLSGMASATACMVTNPIDVFRVQLQLPHPPAQLAMAETWSSMATLAVHRSLGWAMAYNVVLNSLRFPLFKVLTEDAGAPAVASGFVSGLVAGFASSPLASWEVFF